MHNLRKGINGTLAPEGSIPMEQRLDYSHFKSFDEGICQTIRSTLDLIVTCPFHLSAEE